MRVPGAIFRRLIPALGVTGVIVLAALAPAPSLASSTNNCGVKGYGYHDHGKVCPNRPFPGKGVGLAKFGVLSATHQGGKAAVQSNAITLTTTKADTKASKKSTASAAGANRGNSNGRGRSHSGADRSAHRT